VASGVIGLASAGVITAAMLMVAWRRFRKRQPDSGGEADDLGATRPPVAPDSNSSKTGAAVRAALERRS
jgi:hypothetical protein